MTRTHPHRHGSHQRLPPSPHCRHRRGVDTVGVGLGSAGAFADLAAGYGDDLGTLSRVPVPHVLAFAIGTPSPP